MFNFRVTNAIPEELSFSPSLAHVSPLNQVQPLCSPHLPPVHPYASNRDPDPTRDSPPAILFGTWHGLRSLPVGACLEQSHTICSVRLAVHILAAV